MKKKLLKISSVLTIVFLIVAVVFFFLMKKAEPTDTERISKEFDPANIVEKIEFLRFDSYEELKQYADEYPIYIRESDNQSVFGIGEFYIYEKPVDLFYSLNDDGSIKRFDGYYSYELSDKSAQGVQGVTSNLNSIVAEYFGVDEFYHYIYDENGMEIETFSDTSYQKMYEGSAKYSVSVVDNYDTYWCMTAVVTDKKQINIEFFRYYGMDLYDVDYANLDLRLAEETGEE